MTAHEERPASFEVDPDLDRVFARTIAAEYAYLTPRGDPLCWPVTPYWYPDRRILGVATGLAYPNKADYPKRNPKVAMLFSDFTGSGTEGHPQVLVQGDAEVFDEDIQANTDRYVKEMRARFPAAGLALNGLTVRFLDFYLPRLWVEITPLRIRPSFTGEAPSKSCESRFRGRGPGGLSPSDARALGATVKQFGEAVATVKGEDGYPQMIRTAVGPAPGGAVRLERVPGSGPACLTFHHHSLGGLRFQAYMARGFLEEDCFVPSRLVGFFGNGAIFPFSVIPRIPELRRRLHAELEKRGQPMPRLRVP
jgi:hypothetical protein